MHFIVMRASQAPALSRALSAGQTAAMRPYGIEHIVKPTTFPGAMLVAAEVEPGVPLGGLRVEPRTATHLLPLEQARETHFITARKIGRRAEEGLAELGGLWVSSTSTEPDLPARLVRLGIAVAQAEGFQHLVALCGHHSLHIALACGFRLEPGEPVIPYPDARYRSRVAWMRLPVSSAVPRFSSRRSS
jgi:hypothetical protein